MDMSERRGGLGESALRIGKFAARGLLYVSGILSAVLVVAGAAIYVGRWYDAHYRWREREYAKLRSLHAGYTFGRFKAELGAPVFSRRNARFHLREDTFRGHGYWVQTVTQADGTVLSYAVTSCDPDFRPKFVITGSGPSSREPDANVVLNDSTFRGVLGRQLDPEVRAHYFLGATADTYFYDEFYGANPGFYQTYVWGLNDACPSFGQELDRVARKVGYPKLKPRPGTSYGTSYNGPVAKSGDWAMRFRGVARVNTYMETAPVASYNDINRAFHVGVDRLLTRTTGQFGHR
jgi:hypothetical protein